MEVIRNIDYSGFFSLLSFIEKEEWEKRDGALFVADDNTASFLAPHQRERAVILPPGETAKTFASVEKILSRAVDLRLDRSSVLIGVGGGVICDMTAFAASLYMRGCQVELVPTTLLAMVDAAVGGKTGVDFGHYKNMIGTFNPARKVHFPLFTLKSLPQKEYLCGLAEVLKTALLGDEKLWGILEDKREDILNRDPLLIKDMIYRCAQVKGRIVQEDLKEKGLRASLNLGHTFGHALEAVTGFSLLSHGEAVAWGLGKAALASLRLNLINQSFYERITSLLAAYGYKKDYDFPLERLIDAMGHDKKISEGKIRFILPVGMEKIQIRELEDTLLREVLKG